MEDPLLLAQRHAQRGEARVTVLERKPKQKTERIYIAGRKVWANPNGQFTLKLGSSIVVKVSEALGADDYLATIDILGEGVFLDFRTTPEAAALLVTRKLRQIFNSLKLIGS